VNKRNRKIYQDYIKRHIIKEELTPENPDQQGILTVDIKDLLRRKEGKFEFTVAHCGLLCFSFYKGDKEYWRLSSRDKKRIENLKLAMGYHLVKSVGWA